MTLIDALEYGRIFFFIGKRCVDSAHFVDIMSHTLALSFTLENDKQMVLYSPVASHII